LRENWLTGRRRSGATVTFAPTELTSGSTDPIIDLITPRADLRSSLYQMLIGVLQSTFEPRNEGEWARHYAQPPGEADLARAFQSAGDAFDLQHETHPFLQEPGIESPGDPMTELVFGLPGESTKKANKDLFLKRDQSGALCAPCTATALYSLQAQASGGGAGYSVSLRGGGPLSTIVLDADLWHTCWMNVIPREAWQPDVGRSHDAKTYPWLAGASASPKRGVLTLQSVAIGHHYWGMPRRVRLAWADSPQACALCGRRDAPTVVAVHQKPGGYQYQGPWDHPLSPTREDKATHSRITLKGSPTAAGYRHWRGLILDNPEGKVSPALTIRHLLETRRDTLDKWAGWQVWVNGSAFDKDKLEGYYESTLPQITIPRGNDRARFEDDVRALIESAEAARKHLYAAAATAAEPAKPPHVDEPFWSATEPHFYTQLAHLAETDPTDARAVWYQDLRRETLTVFRAAFPTADLAQTDPARVVAAERRLDATLRGRKLRAILRLDPPTLVTP
jgi:CRISPR system Cascade subunit CasA